MDLQVFELSAFNCQHSAKKFRLTSQPCKYDLSFKHGFLLSPEQLFCLPVIPAQAGIQIAAVFKDASLQF